MLDILQGALYFLFVVSALLIILLVLFRPSEGGGMAGAFGGMGSDNVFGVRATQMIDKVIATIAAAFVLLAVLIGVISASQSSDNAGDNETVRAAPAEREGEAEVVTFIRYDV